MTKEEALDVARTVLAGKTRSYVRAATELAAFLEEPTEPDLKVREDERDDGDPLLG